MPVDVNPRWAMLGEGDFDQSGVSVLSSLPNPLEAPTKPAGSVPVKSGAVAPESGQPPVQPSLTQQMAFGGSILDNLLNKYEGTGPAKKFTAQVYTHSPESVLSVVDSYNALGNQLMNADPSRPALENFNMGDVVNVAGALTTPAVGGKYDPNVTSIFGTRDIPEKSLNLFKELKAKGTPVDQIWQKTGVWEYRPNMFIKEWDDSVMKIKPEALQPVDKTPIVASEGPKGWTSIDNSADWKIKGIAEDVLDHADLFGAYPALRGIEIDITHSPGIEGHYTGSLTTDQFGRMKITGKAGNVQDARSLIIHELQHAVQELDDMPRGGNSSYRHNSRLWEDQRSANIAQISYDMHKAAADAVGQPINGPVGMMTQKARLNAEEIFRAEQNGEKNLTAKMDAQLKLLTEITNEMGDKAPEFLTHYENFLNVLEEAQPNGSEVYKRLSGEVQARLADRRQNLTAAERQDITPMHRSSGILFKNFREDVPLIKQIDTHYNPDIVPPPKYNEPSSWMKPANDNTKQLDIEQLNLSTEDTQFVRAIVSKVYTDNNNIFKVNRLYKSGVTESDLFHVIDSLEIGGVDSIQKVYTMLNNHVKEVPNDARATALLQFVKDLVKHVGGRE